MDKGLTVGLTFQPGNGSTQPKTDNPSFGSTQTGVSSGNQSGSRRKLPRTPDTTNSSDGNEVLIQSWLDADRRELVVSIICARLHRLQQTPCFGQVRILPTP